MQGSADLPVLYSFRRCPYAIRARMALHCARVAVEIREVALRDKPAAMLAISPKATVPVLQLPDGSVIDESLGIMLWALRQRDPQAWLQVGDDHADAARTWVARNDAEFKPLLDAYKYPRRHPGLSPQEHRERALSTFVAAIDARLRGMLFLLADRPSWADVAVFPFMRQFAMVDPVWFEGADLPALKGWLGHWSCDAAFHAVMEKNAVWVDPALQGVVTGH